MPTVSNTSPLLNLAIIGELELVRAQFSSVLVPPAVIDEFQLETERPGTAALSRALDDGWIEPEEPSDTPLIRTLWQDIDRGEAEAIAVATEVEADRVLIDEREARRRARNLGLEVTGALGILLQAAQEGSLDSLADALDRLEEEAGFWIAPALRRQIMNELGEG